MSTTILKHLKKGKEDKMKVDEIIELENGTSYLLLLDSTIDNIPYFLAVKLNEQEEPTNDYIVLKEITENNETYIQKVTDPIILSKLITEYSLDYESDYLEEA